MFKLLFPLLGGLGLLAGLRDHAVRQLRRLTTAAARASPAWGLVLILGLGLIVVGLVFMFLMRARQPAFFRGETLRKDTPVVVLDEP